MSGTSAAAAQASMMLFRHAELATLTPQLSLLLLVVSPYTHKQ